MSSAVATHAFAVGVAVCVSDALICSLLSDGYGLGGNGMRWCLGGRDKRIRERDGVFRWTGRDNMGRDVDNGMERMEGKKERKVAGGRDRG
jgi:hypothetical protein